ncbi:hypothetical protein NL50_17925 [Clostridium acetobutylicum]|nr:hypothetical protein NL50_17925 [Clostridium acetobutylicum]
MLYDFMFGVESTFEEIKEFIIKEIIKENVLTNAKVVINSENRLSFISEAFNSSLSAGGQGLLFMSEDYDINLKYGIDFDIHPEYIRWPEDLMTFVGYIIKKYSGEFLLESNGDNPILISKNGIIIVDDKKLKRTKKLPFELLAVDYKEGNIE